MNAAGFIRPTRCACGATFNYSAALAKHRATCKAAKRARWTADDAREARR